MNGPGLIILQNTLNKLLISEALIGIVKYIPGHRNIADALSRMPCLSLYVTTRSQAQQAPDVRVEPDGEALTGSPIKPKRKQRCGIIGANMKNKSTFVHHS